jgi:tyrosine-protein kinase Etk/Wzc
MQQASGNQKTAPKDHDEIDLGRLLGHLLSNKWRIIIITACFSLIGVAYALLSTPIYRADALIQVEKKSSAMPALGEMGELFAGESQAATEIEIIKSRMVVGSVVDQLDLTTQYQPNYLPVIGAYLARRSGKPDQLLIQQFSVPNAYIGEDLTLVLQNNQFVLSHNLEVLLEGEIGTPAAANGFSLHLSDVQLHNTNSFTLVKANRLRTISNWQSLFSVAERGRQTGILTASIQHPNRRQAVTVLDAIANEYMLQNIRRNAAEAEKSLAFLEQQIPTIQQNLVQAEEQLNTYRLESRSVDLNLETSGLLSQVIDVEKQLNELSIKETELARLYTRQHPSFQALMQQKQSLLADQERLAKQIQNLPETQQQVLRLTRDVQVNQEIYLQLVNRMQELNVLKAGTVGNVRILDNAEVNPLPVAPKKPLIVVLATMLGGMLALAWVFIKAALHRGIEAADQLEEEGISVYASVPLSEIQQKLNLKILKRGRKKGQTTELSLLAKEDPTDLAIEALRGLRTSLHFAMLEASNNIVMISGPSPSVGKSFISANLAAVLAQSGQKVLVIDGDLRRGYLHTMLKSSNKFGLSNFLAYLAANKDKSVTEYRKIIESGLVPNMDFISRGVAAPNPSELLMHPRMQELMQQVSADYDYVIIDTPPILAVTDAAIVGRYVGTSLLVARFGQSQVKEMAHTVKRFEQNGIEIKGVILNGVERKAAAYYGYGYQYGYAYKTDKNS